MSDFPARIVLVVLFMLAFARLASAEQVKFSDAVKASLVFRAENDPASPYPHLIKVYLRLENIHGGEVSWVADSVSDVRAEVLDPEGKPLQMPPGAASIQSNASPLYLPYGSRLDWLISHGGVSLMGDTSKMYALVIGARGWLIPMDSVSSYTLRIKLHGYLWSRDTTERRPGGPPLLLDLPPAKIEITKER